MAMAAVNCSPSFSAVDCSRRSSVVSLRSGFLGRRSSASDRSKLVGFNSSSRGAVVASWDFGRFVKTIFFFNEPSFPKLVQSIMERFAGSTEEPSKQTIKNPTGDLVLVTGATGGVGKRVVDVLRKKGIPVRVLVRNTEKARTLLGSDTDIVTGDITKKATLLPEYFYGVKKVISAASVIVGPKEGDTPDRQKYTQGIKFFMPEIKGDPPEAVEYEGMRNLIDAVRDHVGLLEGKLLIGFYENGIPFGPAWGALDDVVMGGVSESFLQVGREGEENVGIFKGVVSTANNGGFASIRTKNFDPILNLSAYDGLELRLKGNGKRLKLIVRVSQAWDGVGYTASFDTPKDTWTQVRIPFSKFIPVFRAKTVKDAPAFDVSSIVSLQLMYSKFEYDGKLNPTFEPGPFAIPVASIKAYLVEPVTPRFVHVSSAGVTRPDRPGLDLSKQPPAVRMNKELGGILTYKLKGEDLIRDSGMSYTIVRPCALTEEPAGAELEFDQGDNITGKISREEVARICVAALASPAACNVTFEVKSKVPFSETFSVDPTTTAVERDYAQDFEKLKQGVTGKISETQEALVT